jgi:predicted TIM-barrel fold metal-dependent hydrolase
MLGWRFALLGPGQRSWPSDGTMDWLWPAAEEAGIPISMLAYDFLPTVGRIAERHPRLKLTVDHLGGRGGTTPKKDAAYFDAIDQLVALARYPNVAVKATGAPGYSTEPYPYRSIQPFLQRIFDAFGPERFFWGSDITRMPCPWRQVVTLFTEELAWLRGRDLELVMGEAACRWLDWDIL